MNFLKFFAKNENRRRLTQVELIFLGIDQSGDLIEMVVEFTECVSELTFFKQLDPSVKFKSFFLELKKVETFMLIRMVVECTECVNKVIFSK